MCGRYTLSISSKPDLRVLGVDQSDRFNIAPATKVLVIRETNQVALMNWSLSPIWARSPMRLFNARSETLYQKPAFSGADRCAFIADGWYEWQRLGQSKLPWYHHRAGDLLYFAGIYHSHSGAAIVTMEANEMIAHVHHRQPLLLDGQNLENWLEGADPHDCVEFGEILVHRVDAAVGDPRLEGSHLIAPLAQSHKGLAETQDLF